MMFLIFWLGILNFCSPAYIYEQRNHLKKIINFISILQIIKQQKYLKV